MAEEARVRRKALKERLSAKRRAKEAGLENKGAGEKERCDQNMDLNRLEELEAEVNISRGAVCLAYAPVVGVGGDPLVFKVTTGYATSFLVFFVNKIHTFLVILSLPSRFLGLCGPLQALDENLKTERQARLKEVRACAAAAEEAVTLANRRAAGGAEVDPTAAVTSSKMKVREKSPGLKAVEG